MSDGMDPRRAGHGVLGRAREALADPLEAFAESNYERIVAQREE